MKTQEQIVLDNLDLIDTCIKYQTNKHKQFADDLRQELCVQLLEMDIEKLNRIVEEGHLNAFLTKIIFNSLHSETAPFFRLFIAPMRKSREIEKYKEKISEET